MENKDNDRFFAKMFDFSNSELLATRSKEKTFSNFGIVFRDEDCEARYLLEAECELRCPDDGPHRPDCAYAAFMQKEGFIRTNPPILFEPNSPLYPPEVDPMQPIDRVLIWAIILTILAVFWVFVYRTFIQ